MPAMRVRDDDSPGPYGEFYGCKRFPECRGTAPALLAADRVKLRLRWWQTVVTAKSAAGTKGRRG